MSKFAKAIGLAVASVPVSFALLGVMSQLGWIDPHTPSAWSIMKLTLLLLGGCAYLLGVKWFKDDSTVDRDKKH